MEFVNNQMETLEKRFIDTFGEYLAFFFGIRAENIIEREKSVNYPDGYIKILSIGNRYKPEDFTTYLMGVEMEKRCNEEYTFFPEGFMDDLNYLECCVNAVRQEMLEHFFSREVHGTFFVAPHLIGKWSSMLMKSQQPSSLKELLLNKYGYIC